MNICTENLSSNIDTSRISGDRGHVTQGDDIFNLGTLNEDVNRFGALKILLPAFRFELLCPYKKKTSIYQLT